MFLRLRDDMDKPLPAEIDEVRWNEACRRADAIRDFLWRYPEGSTAAGVAGLADQLELSLASTYRLIKLFRSGGTATSLVDRKRGRRKGHRTLDDARHKIIRTTIIRFYLKRTRPPFAKLVREVQTNCIDAGLKPPHLRTIKARLEDIDFQRRAKLRGEAKLIKATTATPGELRASRPLEIVQIDHTKADVFIVDEETREPIGRPWLTLAMDVYTRMVTGFYLTMEAPSRLSTSLCLLHSVFDKSAWLREREVHDDWPVAGLPEMLHVDNGADFRSRAFARGCRDAGVKIDWRPPGTPRFGGHIERLIGTHMGALHLLPGSTASNIEERGDYDPKRHSCLTLRELESYIALEIVGSYHQSIHASLGRPPIAVWKELEGHIPLRLPQDRMRFWLSFLPEEERTLRPDGIHLFNLRYWSPALSADVGRTKGRLLVKYDPRDMSRIFVRRPSGGFVEARYADVTLPAVTLREALTARRALLQKGRREVDMRTIIRTVVSQRELVDDAAKKTAAARRKEGKSSKFRAKDNNWGSLRGVDSSKPVSFVEDAD
jgi:putative transposase